MVGGCQRALCLAYLDLVLVSSVWYSGSEVEFSPSLGLSVVFCCL